MDKLRGHVVNGAAESGSPLIDGVGGPSEIAKLNVHFVDVANEDVFGFDVSVYNVTLLQVN